MIPIRRSPDREQNVELREQSADANESNTRWLARTGVQDAVLLLGGASVADFRIRVAQSLLRSDLLPSFWSVVGILLPGSQEFTSVPLELRGPAADVPPRNAVETCRLADYDDPYWYPNIAVLRFAANAQAIRDHIERVQHSRAIIDLPSLMLPWLGFIWGAGQPANPLLAGHGLPSAAFVETVYNLADVELTPGLSSAASCPEAIWQAAKWWRTFYEETTATAAETQARPIVPTGSYAIRQREAAARERVPRELETRRP